MILILKQCTSNLIIPHIQYNFLSFFQRIIARSENDKQRQDANGSDRKRNARPPRDPGGIRNLGVRGEDDDPAERRA